jgi:hypothetical protein
MNTLYAPHHLGQYILIVLDNAPECLEMMRTVVASLDGIQHRSFGLLHCSPTTYWEHSGADNAVVNREVEEVWEEEEKEFRRTESYFGQARAVLEAAGVPPYKIHSRMMTSDNPAAAIIEELRECAYTGVVVSDCDQDLVNRLRGQGITDIFRHIPDVEVWAIHVGESV